MCEVILMKLHRIRVKLLNIFVVSLFSVALFRRPLHTRLTAGCRLRPMSFVQLGGRLALMKIRLRLIVYLTTVERGVVCFLTTFHL